MKERKEVESLVDYRIAFDRVSLLPREKLSIVVYKNKKDYDKDRFSSCCLEENLVSNIKMGVVACKKEPRSLEPDKKEDVVPVVAANNAEKISVENNVNDSEIKEDVEKKEVKHNKAASKNTSKAKNLKNKLEENKEVEDGKE